MKRILPFIFACLLSIAGMGQSQYSENDVMQFYRTLQGAYTGQLDDSTAVSLHIVSIWERENDRFHWLYLEAVNNRTHEVMEQKILEIKPVSDLSFKVVAHKLKNPEQFEGKWSNPNFFDGFNTGILKGSGTFRFMKTRDFEYQTGWNSRKVLSCFHRGDRIHFKLVQEDERLYVKRLPKRSSHIIGITFTKLPIG